MAGELEFSGACPQCGTELEGFFRKVPRADRLVIFLCDECERATAWIPAPEPVAAKPEPVDVAEPSVSPAPPAKCRICGTSEGFRQWHALDLSGGWLQQPGDSFLFSAPCRECGHSVKISWRIRREIVSTSFRMSAFFWLLAILALVLSPLLLVLSPLIVAGGAVWIKMRGGCLRCGHPLASHHSLPLVQDDGGGSLHRCPRCHAFYYLPIMGPVAYERLSPEAVRRRWPELADRNPG